MPPEYDRQWWERTWHEREEAMWRAFGPSHPTGSPEGYVNSFDFADVRLPGACVFTFRPSDVPVPEGRERRSNWMYVTHGLSQPLSQADPSRGERVSSYGYEFGMIFDQPVDWVAGLLRWMMIYTQQTPLNAGDRVPFQFDSLERGSVRWRIGSDPADPKPADDTRAIMFWRYLSPFSIFITSTGTCVIRIATTITGAEWELAKKTSTAHVVLLLQWAGFGQRSVAGRSCVTSLQGWQSAWDELKSLSQATAEERLQKLSTGWKAREP